MRRGSRKHVLDWTAQECFPSELASLVHPVRIAFNDKSTWMPRGHSAPREARLETFGRKVLPEHRAAWDALRDWWLKHARGANTPNWDVAVRCEVDGRPGLVLIEAKANEPELGSGGKPSAKRASDRSRENHDQIRDAIVDARQALGKWFPAIGIDRDKHYQLSNRIAFAWKLASLGIPTVLLYLGFVGDHGMHRHFRDAAHWDECFKSHLREVCPDEILEETIDLETAPMWVLSRTKKVIGPSQRGDDRSDPPTVAPLR
jgi:hypothetical protein